MGWRYAVEIIAVLVMLAGAGSIIYGAVIKGTIALSLRTIQFLAVTFAIPGILILSLERSIGNEGTTALLGTIIGFVLSGIGKGD